jgi:hypothetical protein
MKATLKVCCAVAFLFITPIPNHALEVDTHKAINEYIAIGIINGFSLDSYLKNQLGFQNGVEEQIKFGDSKKVCSWIGGGGVTEDRPPGFFQIPYLRSTNHFHDPISNQGFGGFIFGVLFNGESSIQWSQRPIGGQSPGGHYSWFDIRDYYNKALTSAVKTDRDKYFAETFRGLGQIMHLVQDISVPDHARNQFHVGYHYEKFVLRYQKEVLPEYKGKFKSLLASPFQFDQSLLNVKSPLAPIPFANLFDSEKYTGSNPGDTLNNNLGLSEYTNANFFSDLTIFKNYSHPKKENTNAILKEEEAEDGEIDRKYYISGYQSENLALYSYIANPAPELPGEWKYTLDDTVHKDYASKLIPRAVGYSAGLLNYFFRGKLGVEQTGVTPSRDVEITITNLSEEPLVDGVFELYYDNENGERIKLKLSATEVKGLQKEATFTTSFRRPSDFETGKEDEYMLVYTGQLGNEVKTEGSKGVVIGKYGFIGRVFPVMATYSQGEMKAFFTVGKMEADEKNHDFFIDLEPVLRELGHSVISPVSLKIVEYSGTLGALVYTVNDTTYCVLTFEVLGLTSPEVEVNGYKKRDFVWSCEQFDMSSATIDPIPPMPTFVIGTPNMPMGTADIWFYDDHASQYVNCSGPMTPGGGYNIGPPRLAIRQRIG